MSLDSFNNLYCSNNLFVQRNLYCAGAIMTENLSVSGTITGNVSLTSANIKNTTITGNATITGNISANISTIKTANITTANISANLIVDDTSYLNDVVIDGDLFMNGDIVTDVIIDGNLSVTGFTDSQVFLSRGQIYLNSSNIHYGNSILATLDSGNLINKMPSNYLSNYGWLTAGNTNAGCFKIPITGYYNISISVRFIESATQLGLQPIYRTAIGSNSNIIIGSDGTYWSMTDVTNVNRRVCTYTDIIKCTKDDFIVPSVWEGSVDSNVGVIWCIASASLLSI